MSETTTPDNSLLTTEMVEPTTELVNGTAIPSSSCSLPFHITYSAVIYFVGWPLIAFGFVSNILCFAVFYKRRHRTPILITLLALSVNDALHCLVWLPYTLDIYKFTGAFQLIHIYGKPFIKFAGQGSVHLTKCFGIYLAAFLAIERLIFIACPKVFKKWFTKGKTLLYLLLIFLLSVIIVAPKLTLDIAAVKFDACIDRSIWVTKTRPGFGSFKNLYYGPIQAVFFYAIPLVIIVFGNIGLIVYLRMNRVRLMDQVSKGEKRLIRLMFAIVWISVLCLLPNAILPSIATTLEGLSTEGERALVDTKHIINVFNSAVNIVVYCMVDPRFRRELCSLCSSKSTGDGEDSDTGEDKENRNQTYTTQEGSTDMQMVNQAM